MPNEPNRVWQIRNEKISIFSVLTSHIQVFNSMYNLSTLRLTRSIMARPGLKQQENFGEILISGGRRACYDRLLVLLLLDCRPLTSVK